MKPPQAGKPIKELVLLVLHGGKRQARWPELPLAVAIRTKDTRTDLPSAAGPLASAVENLV